MILILFSNKSLPKAKRSKQYNEVKDTDDEVKSEVASPAKKPTWRIEVNGSEDKISNPEKNFQSKEKDEMLLQDKCSDKEWSPEEIMRYVYENE